MLEDGDKVIQETRLFDSVKGVTMSMRDKEEAHDYRYFPDPDLVPVHITDEQLESWKASLPELPAQRRRRSWMNGSFPSRMRTSSHPTARRPTSLRRRWPCTTSRAR